MSLVTLRSRDVWRECVRLLDVNPTITPSSKDTDKWVMQVEIDSEWVKDDPLMLQMMHDTAKPYEFVAIKSVANLFTDYWDTISTGSDHNIKRKQLGILGTLAELDITRAEEAASEGCRALYRSHRQALNKYGWYQVKEGITFTTKMITTGVSTGLTGISFGTGGIPAGILGLTGVIKGIVGLANQIADWCVAAEGIQKEINIKLDLLQKRYGGNIRGSKASVTTQEFVEGMFWETIGMGLDRNFGVTIKTVGDLVDLYESKLDGIEKAAHQMSRSLNALLEVTEQMEGFIEVDKHKVDELIEALQNSGRRTKRGKPTSLVGHIDKLLGQLVTTRKQKARNNWGYLKSTVRSSPDYTEYWNFLRSQITTRKQRELLRLERKVHASIERTISLTGRVKKGRVLHRQYAFAMEGLKGKKAKGTDLAVKLTSLMTWNLPQIFVFTDYGELSKNAVELASFLTDISNESLDNSMEFSLWMAEKAA